MQARDYASALAAHGIKANDPLPEAAISDMQHMIDHDFHGGAAPTAQGRLVAYCKSHARPGDAVILACTELPLAYPRYLDEPAFEADGFLFVNPSAAHVAAALKMALADEIAAG